MLSLLDVENSPGIQRVIGVCPTSQDAIDLYNEAGRRLIRRGDWFETYTPIFVCVFNGCLVMPRYVQQIRRVNICNQAINVRNGWYEFLAYNQNLCSHGRWLSKWLGAETGVSQQGVSPVFQDVLGDGRLIRAYPRCHADVGKTMRFFGTDNMGQPLVTVDPVTGAITQGALLTIAEPFGSTAGYVRHIDYVVREATTMIVDVYGYEAASGNLEEIAHYEPTDTTPTFARYRLGIKWPTCGSGTVTPSCCGVSRGVVMMVKLRWIDAKNPYDLVLIPCVDALKLMIMAIKREEQQDRDGRMAFEKDAIEVLNRELENNSPDEQFAVADNNLGPHVWSNQAF